jgi:hypothetical protein
MGNLLSTNYQDFDLGRYWIGYDVHAARKGLSIHFKNRVIKTHSQTNLMDLLHEDSDKDRITILYDPLDMKTTRILVG